MYDSLGSLGRGLKLSEQEIREIRAEIIDEFDGLMVSAPLNLNPSTSTKEILYWNVENSE